MLLRFEPVTCFLGHAVTCMSSSWCGVLYFVYQRAKEKTPLCMSDRMTVGICLPLITHMLTRTAKRVDNQQLDMVC